ncbi:MAG TPA: hypothetical protein VMS17_24935 [Gemmataceae bacterium]|nr:hypothetical protein [Gemmataceae bacterium]
MDALKRLRMFAGPNGSGKTSLARRLAREFAPDGLFYLRDYLNADDLLRDLQRGTGIRFGDHGLTITTEQLRAALAGGGRLRPDHAFVDAVRVADSVVTAPASLCDSYAAAAVADVLRERLLAAGKSFSFETVMSHQSKVDFFARGRAAGYRTYLYFIATESPTLNIHRIGNRTGLGGHDVPEEKIVARYTRCLRLVGAALRHAHRAFLFDNSGLDPVWLAEQTLDGKLEMKVPISALPVWFQTWVAPCFSP